MAPALLASGRTRSHLARPQLVEPGVTAWAARARRVRSRVRGIRRPGGRCTSPGGAGLRAADRCRGLPPPPSSRRVGMVNDRPGRIAGLSRTPAPGRRSLVASSSIEWARSIAPRRISACVISSSLRERPSHGPPRRLPRTRWAARTDRRTWSNGLAGHPADAARRGGDDLHQPPRSSCAARCAPLRRAPQGYEPAALGRARPAGAPCRRLDPPRPRGRRPMAIPRSWIARPVESNRVISSRVAPALGARPQITSPSSVTSIAGDHARRGAGRELAARGRLLPLVAEEAAARRAAASSTSDFPAASAPSTARCWPGRRSRREHHRLVARGHRDHDVLAQRPLPCPPPPSRAPPRARAAASARGSAADARPVARRRQAARRPGAVHAAADDPHRRRRRGGEHLGRERRRRAGAQRGDRARSP